LYGRFRSKRPYPAPLGSESRFDFPTQPLISSVPTINMSASCGVLRVIAKAHRKYRRAGPLTTLTTRGGTGDIVWIK
jgi:hypothetical protein